MATSPVVENDAHSISLEDTASATSKSRRFRFKEKRSRDESEDHDLDHRARAEHRHHRHHRHHHHRHHHRSKRRKTSHPTVDDPSTRNDPASGLHPDTAFRESLFDALGDDEGAAFWEGVYGQPIHEYPDTYRDRETGELEHMNDEEYAQFVRRKMWEKSWEGIEAAREEKRREARQEKEKIRNEKRDKSHGQEVPMQEPDYLFDLKIDESLRRGQRRKEKKHWNALWKDYLLSWEKLNALRESDRQTEVSHNLYLRNEIAWPVESGKRKDVNHDEIERFIISCAQSANDADDLLGSILKSERIRWHPDKIQQRFGFMDIDESTMKSVTAVFQILDRMWNELRTKS